MVSNFERIMLNFILADLIVKMLFIVQIKINYITNANSQLFLSILTQFRNVEPALWHFPMYGLYT